MGAAENNGPVDSLRMLDSEQEGGPAAPVVADDAGAVDPEGVEQRDLVTGERLAVITVPRGLGPAEAAQIRCDQAKAVLEAGEDASPHVVMLGPAVEAEKRRAGSRLGVVDTQAACVDEMVLGPLDRGGRALLVISGPHCLSLGSEARRKRCIERPPCALGTPRLKP